VDIGSAVGSQQGHVDQAKLNALAEWRDSNAFSELERDVLALADAITDTPANVDEGLFGRLLIALGAEQLVELTNAIGWENLRSRTNRMFDAQSENYYDGAVCMLPPRKVA
jgi:alkylhydroperoxidase family enzyme